MEIGNKIRKLRESKEFSQEYVAEKLGMSTNGYGNIERNQVRVSLERLEQIAIILGCSILDFIDHSNPLIFGDNNHNVINGSYTNNYYDKQIQNMEIEHLKSEIQHLKDKIKLLEKISGINLDS